MGNWFLERKVEEEEEVEKESRNHHQTRKRFPWKERLGAQNSIRLISGRCGSYRNIGSSLIQVLGPPFSFLEGGRGRGEVPASRNISYANTKKPS